MKFFHEKDFIVGTTVAVVFALLNERGKRELFYTQEQLKRDEDGWYITSPEKRMRFEGCENSYIKRDFFSGFTIEVVHVTTDLISPGENKITRTLAYIASHRRINIEEGILKLILMEKQR